MPPLRPSLIPTLLLATAFAGSVAPQQAGAQAPGNPSLTPFSAATGTVPPPAWRPVGLPAGKAPLAQMDIHTVDNDRVLRLKTESSYGTLVHAVPGWRPDPGSTLSWRWQLVQPLAQADLRTREGDDAALKVCVMYDMPLERVPFLERNLLRLARSGSGELLPAATVCYVWDAALPAGTTLANPYSRRVRTIVLDGKDSTPGSWRMQERRIHADFLRLFGDEAQSVPPVLAIAVGADSDNTAGRSVAYIAGLRLNP